MPIRAAQQARALVISLCFSAFLLAGPVAWADTDGPFDRRTISGEVDKRINERLDDRGVSRSPRTSDAEFLRRVSLDIAGKLPTPEEIIFFALGSDPAKRQRVVERLLDSED